MHYSCLSLLILRKSWNQLSCSLYVTPGRKVGRFFGAKKSVGFSCRSLFQRACSLLKVPWNLRKIDGIFKLKFHKLSKLPDRQIWNIRDWKRQLDKKIHTFFWRFSCTDAPSDRASYEFWNSIHFPFVFLNKMFFFGKLIVFDSKFSLLDFWNLVRFLFVFYNKFFFGN